MVPNKIGQIVKYHTPFPSEDPNQLYVVLEIFLDVERPRALIKELNKARKEHLSGKSKSYTIDEVRKSILSKLKK